MYRPEPARATIRVEQALEYPRIAWEIDAAPLGLRRAAVAPSPRTLGAYRQPPAGDLRGSSLLLGAGKRFIAIQTGLREAATTLDHGDPLAARRGLAAMRSALGGLARELMPHGLADDPNLIALRDEVTRLDARLASVGG